MTRSLLILWAGCLCAWSLVSFGCSWDGDVGNQDFNEPGDDGYLDIGFGVTPDERFVVGATESSHDRSLLHFVDTTTGDITVLDVASEDDKRIVFDPDEPRAWFMAQPYGWDPGEEGEVWTLVDLTTLTVLGEQYYPAAFWGTRLTDDGALFAAACRGVVYVVDASTLQWGTIEPPSEAHELFEADWIPGTHRLVISWTVSATLGESRQTSQRSTQRHRRSLPSDGWAPDGSGPMLRPVGTLELDRRWLNAEGTEVTAYDIEDVEDMPSSPTRTTFVEGSHPSFWWGYGFFGMHPGGETVVVPLETFETASSWWGVDSLLILDPDLQTVGRVAGRGPVGFTPDGQTLVAYDFTDHADEVEDVFLMLYDTDDFSLERVELSIGIPAYFITPDGAEILLFSYYDIFSTGHENGLLLFDTASGETRHLDDSVGRHVNEAVITPDGERVYFVDWADSGEDWFGLYTIDLRGLDVDRVPVAFEPYNINILPSHGQLVMSEYASPRYYFLGLDSWSVEMYVDAG